MPYTKLNSEHIRYDSAFSAVSLEHMQCQTPANSCTPPSPSLLWYAVLAGATDYTNTIYFAERLLGYIWSVKNAAEFLEVVGNPAK
jgi:hypothetical protein